MSRGAWPGGSTGTCSAMHRAGNISRGVIGDSWGKGPTDAYGMRGWDAESWREIKLTKYRSSSSSSKLLLSAFCLPMYFKSAATALRTCFLSTLSMSGMPGNSGAAGSCDRASCLGNGLFRSWRVSQKIKSTNIAAQPPAFSCRRPPGWAPVSESPHHPSVYLFLLHSIFYSTDDLFASEVLSSSMLFLFA